MYSSTGKDTAAVVKPEQPPMVSTDLLALMALNKFIFID